MLVITTTSTSYPSDFWLVVNLWDGVKRASLSPVGYSPVFDLCTHTRTGEMNRGRTALVIALPTADVSTRLMSPFETLGSPRKP